MSTNPKNALSDITEHGLTGEGLPSTTLREVRRAREGQSCGDTRAPSMVGWGPYEAELTADQAKRRQDLTGNHRKGKPDR